MSEKAKTKLAGMFFLLLMTLVAVIQVADNAAVHASGGG